MISLRIVVSEFVLPCCAMRASTTAASFGDLAHTHVNMIKISEAQKVSIVCTKIIQLRG